jgi:hypothetical protein
VTCLRASYKELSDSKRRPPRRPICNAATILAARLRAACELQVSTLRAAKRFAIGAGLRSCEALSP